MHRIITLLAALLVLTTSGPGPAETSLASPMSGETSPLAEPGFSTEPPEQFAAPATSAVGAAIPCASLWPTSGNLKDTGLIDCIEYDSSRIGGADYRVFFPVEWVETGGWGTDFLPLVMQAVEQTVPVYRTYGTMSAVNILFSINQRPNAEADAGLVDFVSDEPCSILIYPLVSTSQPGSFQQAIAHELFHCFQEWNLTAQRQVDGPAAAWWVEGTAEYFSNVAFPMVNTEWRRLPSFDAFSSVTPLTQFTYENALFFQFLGNEIGNDGILKLLGSLPASGGEAEQQAALRAFPGFAALFQKFAQQYMDKAIRDTSGELIPVKPEMFPSSLPFGRSTTETLTPAPFVVARERLVFKPEPTFSITTDLSGRQSGYATRRVDRPGDWGQSLPSRIACGDVRDYLVVVTTLTAPPAGAATATFTIAASKAVCEPDPALAENDPCLVGTWTVTNFEAAILGSYAATNAEITLEFAGTTGSLAYTFDDQEVTLTADAFEIGIKASIAGTVADITILMNGTTSASYHPEPGGTGVVDETPNQISVLVTVFLDGDPVYSDEIPALWQLVGGPFQYACTADALDLVVPGPDGQMLPPVVLTRQA